MGANEGTSRCKDCRFYVKHEPQHIYGDCHRMPPQFSFYANIYEPAGYGSEKKRIDITRERGGVWPNISQDDWCGEFSPTPSSTGEASDGE